MGFTELVCVIDRSGSMIDTKQSAEEGFNAFIRNQKALDQPCAVTLHQFDTTFETVWPRQLIDSAPGDYVLEPRFGTALNDAIGRTINSIGDIKDDRQVIVVIVTDGGENSSVEFTTQQIKEMVETRQGKGWSFVFIGAGIDAFAEGGGYGIVRGSTMTTAPSAQGFTAAYASLDSAVSTSRLAGKSVNFSDEERSQVEETLTST